MALVVCTASPGAPADWRRNVTCLDQAFYAWLVHACWRQPAFPRLSSIAALDYGEELSLDAGSMRELLSELPPLVPTEAREGAAALRQVCEQAIAAGEICWVAGDMHPVLTNGLQASLRPVSLRPVSLRYVMLVAVVMTAALGVLLAVGTPVPVQVATLSALLLGATALQLRR